MYASGGVSLFQIISEKLCLVQRILHYIIDWRHSGMEQARQLWQFYKGMMDDAKACLSTKKKE